MPKIIGVQNHRGESTYTGSAGEAETRRLDDGSWVWRGPQHDPGSVTRAASRTEANICAMAAAMGER